MEQRVIKCEGEQKKLVSLIHSLFVSKKITVLQNIPALLL